MLKIVEIINQKKYREQLKSLNVKDSRNLTNLKKQKSETSLENRNQKKYRKQLDSLNMKDSARLKPHGLSSLSLTW